MLKHQLMGKYVLVKKSTLALSALAAAAAVGYHFYKYHHAQVKHDINQLTNDVTDVAKKGTRKVKEVVDEVKA